MADDRLWKLEVNGDFQDVNDSPPTEPLSRWALTWWVFADANGFTVARANDLILAASGIYGLFAAEEWWYRGNFITTMKAIHVESGSFNEQTLNDRIGSTFAGRVGLPYQVCVMAWGSAKELGRQVRHWFAGWNSIILAENGSIADGAAANLDSFCRQWFIPQTAGATTFTPVIYDATNDVAREIVESHRAGYFRTIRRRATDAEFPPVEL